MEDRKNVQDILKIAEAMVSLEKLSQVDSPHELSDIVGILLDSIVELSQYGYDKFSSRDMFAIQVAESKNNGFNINEPITDDFVFVINVVSGGNPGRAVILSGVIIKLHKLGIIDDYSLKSIESASYRIKEEFFDYYNDAYHRENPHGHKCTDPYVWEDIVNMTNG